MPAADSSGPDESPTFRSPKRTLARAFRLSRDRWKVKATQRREQLRAMKVRLRDVEASRDLWKQKALHLQEQIDQLLGLTSAPLPEQDTMDSSPRPTLSDSDAHPADEPAPALPQPPTPSEESVKKKRRR